jgi:WD40 repeat protein
MHKQAHIFISYSRQDGAEAAAKLRGELEEAGFAIWQDLIALEGGRDWWSQIEDALRAKALHHLVLVVTPAALDSRYVRREIRLARQEGKTVSAVKGPGLGDLNTLPRWLGHIYDLDIPEQRKRFLRVLEGPSTQKRVPMMAPEPPADFVQRPVEFEALKAKLLDAKGDAVAITAALRGAGGYGKTTLARALAHDPGIEDAYFDGVLWAELGEKPDNLLSIVADLIEIVSGERPGLENLNSAAAKLGEALGDRRILLVIDDAWREQDLRPFLHGGRNTSRLITTRRDDILPLKAERQPVDAMAADEALALLASGLPVELQSSSRGASAPWRSKPESATSGLLRPSGPRNDENAALITAELEKLAQRLGEWAQLLKLVNGFLRDRVCKNRQPLDQAIAGVNRRLTEKGLDAFSARDEADRSRAIAKTIGVSLDLLTEDERARFAELAVFPEDVDVPLGVVARFWRETGGLDEFDTDDLLHRLQNLSLLLTLDLDRRTFRFHDTVRQFLQHKAGKETLATLHKRFFDAIEIGDWADELSHRYYYTYLPTHLAAAGERAILDGLFLNPSWLAEKLDSTGSPQALVADYDQFAQGETQKLIGRTLRLTSGICARDARQLIPQLHGRLMSRPAVADFCAKAQKLVVPTAILALWPSLTPPGAELARLEGHVATVNALTALPDGRLASGSGDNTIRLWDPKSGQELVQLAGHEDSVRALAVLRDGRLASGSYDKTIRLWDPKSGQELARLAGHEDAVKALAVLRDGCLASASYDNTIRLWDPKSGQELARLVGHDNWVNALAMLPDGRLASGSDDKTIRLWDPKSGQELARLAGHEDAVNALAVLRDGSLASASYDNTIRLWDPKSGRELARLAGHENWVRALAVLPDGRLASGSSDKTIRLWDPKSGRELAQLAGHEDVVRALAILADGRLASASGDKTIRLWDPKSGQELPRLAGHIASVNALTALPDGRLASGAGDKTIRLWDPKSGQELARLVGHENWVNALAVLPDGRLASGSDDKTIRLWDPKSGQELARLEGHVASVRALAVLPDGRLASGSYDSTIRLWDLKSGQQPARLAGHVASVKGLAVLPDGRFASASGDQTIRLWDPKSGQELARLEGHEDAVRALAVLPDGCLASGSYDSTIRLWDPKSGQELARLEGHDNWVRALAALPDGRLASGSSDNTIRLWDPKSGQELVRLEVDFAVLCLALPGGNRLAAGDAGGRIHWLEILD